MECRSIQVNFCLVACFCAAAAWTVLASAAEPDPGAIRVVHDREAFVTTIHVPARDGEVAWLDILRGVSRARGFDDAALDELGRRGSIPVDSPFVRPIIATLNATFSPDIEFSLAAARGQNEPAALQIRLNRKALLASHREISRRLRRSVTASLRPAKRYGIRLDKGWQLAPPDQPLVLLVHGLQSSGDHMANLLVRQRSARMPCGVFDYPNDQPIPESARLLADELQRFRDSHPRRRVALLTHSMGGLVARAVVEDPALDPGNVDRLIMISPPTQGSVLAEFGFGLDLCEAVLGADRRDHVRWAAAAIEDGLADAQVDLQPGSPFLTTLNARHRNPKIRYTVILGDVATLTAEELVAARRMLARAGATNRWVRFFGSRVDRWLADLDEVVDGRGDGVVALKRGRLAGVEDTVIRHFSHLSFNRAPMTGEAELVLEDVMRRLR